MLSARTAAPYRLRDGVGCVLGRGGVARNSDHGAVARPATLWALGNRDVDVGGVEFRELIEDVTTLQKNGLLHAAGEGCIPGQ